MTMRGYTVGHIEQTILPIKMASQKPSQLATHFTYNQHHALLGTSLDEFDFALAGWLKLTFNTLALFERLI